MSDRFGDYLINKGILERDDVLRALEVQAESTVKVGTICLEEGYMTVKQVMDTLRSGADSGKEFEDIAISLAYLTAQQLAQALKVQGQRRPFFGELLVNLGFLERTQLFEELSNFWVAANEPKDKSAAEAPKKPKEVGERVLTAMDFPMMYPEELREFQEDIEHSLQAMAIELTNFRPGADVVAVSQNVAFLANKIRGAAELDAIRWLAEVAGEMEQGMLLIGGKPDEEGLRPIIATYFRAADAVHHFIDSIDGQHSLVDGEMAEDLRQSLKGYGALGDLASQDLIGAAMDGKAKERPKRESLEGMHILLIDDDTVIRNTLERTLRSQKTEVEQAKNGAIGLERLLQAMTPFDLVIVDLHMPIMDGFEFVTEVRARPEYEGLPIIMFTASLHMADVRKAIKLGINGYVMKREWKKCLMPEIQRAVGIPVEGEDLWAVRIDSQGLSYDMQLLVKVLQLQKRAIEDQGQAALRLIESSTNQSTSQPTSASLSSGRGLNIYV